MSPVFEHEYIAINRYGHVSWLEMLVWLVGPLVGRVAGQDDAGTDITDMESLLGGESDLPAQSLPAGPGGPGKPAKHRAS